MVNPYIESFWTLWVIYLGYAAGNTQGEQADFVLDFVLDGDAPILHIEL
jgi:hypothetical protein